MLLDLIAALWNASPCAAIIALAPPTLCVLGALFTDRSGPPVRMVRLIGPAVAAGALIATTTTGAQPAAADAVSCPSSSNVMGAELHRRLAHRPRALRVPRPGRALAPRHLQPWPRP